MILFDSLVEIVDTLHGESTAIALLNLERGPEVCRLRLVASATGFVRGLETNAIYYVALREDGTRVVDRYPVPDGFCGR